MIRITAAIALACMAATAAFAQTAPPTYQGDPDVYKVIFEDQNFRVIAVTRKKGVHDKAHGHPVPSIVYNITDCAVRAVELRFGAWLRRLLWCVFGRGVGDSRWRVRP